MITICRPNFSPVQDTIDKPNCKRLYRIEQNGTVTERVFLDVADAAERERLICLHYLRHMVKHFLADDVGVRILARDRPWDFRIQLSTGHVFNIEITAIADSQQHFEINKREERLSTYINCEQISMRELRRLCSWFSDPHLEATVKELEACGIKPDQIVENPLQADRVRILLSARFSPKTSLEEQLRTVIEKKLAKRHQEKERTVIIIDNRTSAFDAQDYVAAVQALQLFIESTPFPEVWFYTGYYSDNDGNNAEFSLSPIKVTEEQARTLETLITRTGVDESSRIVW